MLDFEISDIRKYNNEMIEKIIINMSDFRRDKYLLFKNEMSKKESAVASAILDKLLKKYGYNEKDVIYKLGEYGKPYFANIDGLYFNISHSNNAVLVCISDKQIGCDIERVKEVEEAVYNLVLSDVEKNRILEIKDKISKTNEFIKYWVVKEAMLKKIGDGISKIKETIPSLDKINNINEYVLNDINEKYYYYIEK